VRKRVQPAIRHARTAQHQEDTMAMTMSGSAA
jgi:hypothetical protein